MQVDLLAQVASRETVSVECLHSFVFCFRIEGQKVRHLRAPIDRSQGGPPAVGRLVRELWELLQLMVATDQARHVLGVLRADIRDGLAVGRLQAAAGRVARLRAMSNAR